MKDTMNQGVNNSEYKWITNKLKKFKKKRKLN